MYTYPWWRRLDITGRFADPVYIHELPCYSLPDFKFKTDGTMRSFEVSGESMSLHSIRVILIICGYIHPFHWEKQIRDQKLYVFVTDTDVVVKRSTNLLRSERKLLLHSDNTNFNSYAVEADKIKEVWQVKAKISTQLDPPSNKSQGLELVVDQLKNMILQQNQVLEEILEKWKLTRSNNCFILINFSPLEYLRTFADKLILCKKYSHFYFV
ncbi:MAG: hypothetical protein IPI90_07690 [Saprospiraceae bacterium]|nr:hypothetical protein [Candidatus Vicinibacter affinis]